MKYSLVIFDLDGTVLDTLEDLYDAVNFALMKNNLPQRKIEEIRSFVGNGIRLLIERSVCENTDDGTVNAVFSDFKSYYAEHSCDKTKPYDGVTELLWRLKAKGVQIAVVSNKADFAVQALVQKFFPDCFNIAVGEREGILKKPAPDSVFEVLKRLDIDAHSCVYVGDSEVDIQTSENAGINCISVDWGFRDREELLLAGAEIIASDINELYSYLL
ncbi:MAG: HAD-IIIA family hydrolase [Clostridia bacterium]|nr:HAD-IIIA family hydrolase [Clostridia bacterium]